MVAFLDEVLENAQHFGLSMRRLLAQPFQQVVLQLRTCAHGSERDFCIGKQGSQREKETTLNSAAAEGSQMQA